MLKSGEDYLEAIYVLMLENKSVRSIDIARHMNFSKASVSRAVGNLRSEGLLTVRDNGELVFTSEGKRLARNIYERHMVIENFFISNGISKEIASKDACEIEHVISEEVFELFKRLQLGSVVSVQAEKPAAVKSIKAKKPVEAPQEPKAEEKTEIYKAEKKKSGAKDDKDTKGKDKKKKKKKKK